MDDRTRVCFKNKDGSLAVSWELGSRKRLTKVQFPAAPEGLTLVCDDVFDPSHPDKQLDMFFQKALSMKDTRFVIITENQDRMDRYMDRLFMISEHWTSRPEWLKKFRWPNFWHNIWFGVGYRLGISFDRLDQLTKAWSSHRFVVIEKPFSVEPGWVIPKCRKCNGLGWTLEEPFAIHPRAVICKDCPGWALLPDLERTSPDRYCHDAREQGGEINLFVVPERARIDGDTMNGLIAASRTYGTSIFVAGMPKRFRANPLWRD